MRKRMATAVRLHGKLTDILNTNLECSKVQAVLALTTRLLAHKLDYDARVSSFAHLSDHTQQLQSLVNDLVARCCGVQPLPPSAVQQSQLPTSLGGIGIVSIINLCHIAPLAHFLQTHHAIIHWLTNAGIPLPLHSPALSYNQANDALAFLASQHIEVRADLATVIMPSRPLWAGEARTLLAKPLVIEILDVSNFSPSPSAQGKLLFALSCLDLFASSCGRATIAHRAAYAVQEGLAMVCGSPNSSRVRVSSSTTRSSQPTCVGGLAYPFAKMS